MSQKSMINKICVTVDSQTKVSCHGLKEVMEPEIIVDLSDGSFINFFGDEEDLLRLADLIHKTVHEKLSNRSDLK